MFWFDVFNFVKKRKTLERAQNNLVSLRIGKTEMVKLFRNSISYS